MKKKNALESKKKSQILHLDLGLMNKLILSIIGLLPFASDCYFDLVP